MGNEVGRTGFHVTHTKAVSERGAILDEMMREKIPGASKRWAKRNPNIVLRDEGLNIAYVNDGKGGFVRCKDPKEVLAYGQQRLAKLSTPVKGPKLDPVTGKEKGGTTTSSMFVLHLPKSLCEEVKDFYPILDEDGNEIGRRSRWVARDRKEAVRYFRDALAYMAQEVIPGGWDAILGADIQFSESTPHIQILADTFAPDPKHEGSLRCEFSRAYGSHRDIRDEKGRQMSGQAKFRRYHAGLKEWMLDKGWEIEADVDPLRHDKTATKETYGWMMDSDRAFRQKVQAFDDDIREQRAELHEIQRKIAADEERVNLARQQVEEERSSAREKGYAKGLDEGRAAVAREREQLQTDKKKALEDARKEGYAKGVAEGRAEADALKAQARQKLDEASALVDKAAKQDEPMPLVQTRVIFKLATEMMSKRLKDKGILYTIVDGVKEWADGYVKTPGFEKDMQGAKAAYDRRMERIRQDYEQIKASAQQLDSLTPGLDDGPEF